LGTIRNASIKAASHVPLAQQREDSASRWVGEGAVDTVCFVISLIGRTPR
jgi:hypothetical protein